MESAFYAGAAGLIAHQEALNTIGHNISNVNTTGYKAQGISFDELLYNRMYANTEKAANSGYGVKSVSTGILFGQAAFMQTGNPTSFAISGDGFFAVEKNGQTLYTRDGALSISVEGEKPYLVSADGGYVLDSSGQRITVDEKKPLDLKDPDNNTDGNNDNDNTGSDTDKRDKGSLGLDYEGIGSKIAVYRFANPNALQAVSSNRYAATDNSGAAQAVEGTDKKVLSGYLEQSGVTIVDEMANMIAAQRGYQLSARVVQTADEVEQTVSNLRK